jgi:GDP-L-fucose synthase
LGAAIHKIGIAKRENSKSVGIWGDGTARREFTYVGDVANWIVKNMEKLSSLPQTLNLGQGKEHSILEYYQNVAEVVEYHGKFEFDLNAPVGLKQKLLDSSIAFSNFGWNPQTKLYDGISNSYDWWLKNARS